MKRMYRLPIMGKVINDNPLEGDEVEGLQPIHLVRLPTWTEELGAAILRNFNYNVDEEWVEVEIEASKKFHDWLHPLLPKLRDLMKAKGWKLDKSELVKTRLARGKQ